MKNDDYCALYDCPECGALVSELNLTKENTCPYCGCEELEEIMEDRE